MRTRQRFPQRPLSLALIDLDHFKAINDLQGHAEGDRILQRVAGILKQEMREGLDGAFRVGGDEFLLLLPDTPKEGALIIGERILAEFRKSPQGPVSLSIGVASDEGTPPGNDLEDAIRKLRGRADAAMYRAKQAGGNRIQSEDEPSE
jgi:diguanylate cyclase (GGDEF)-like protein